MNQNQPDASLQQLVEQIEKDLLDHIYLGVQDKEISPDEAQQLAKDFLALLPFRDKKDLLDKLNELGKHHKDAQKLYMKYGVPFEEEERHRKLAAMRDHIKAGNIEKAIAVAKGTLDVSKGGQHE